MVHRPDDMSFRPIERHLTPESTDFIGYDTLQDARMRGNDPELFHDFDRDASYNAYLKMHKVYVGRKGGRELAAMAESLSESWLPDYLQAGGWAAAEASIVCDDLPTAERMRLMDIAEDCWARALHNQSDLNETREKPWLIDDINEFRIALNLAYAPMIRSIIAGNVTKATREKVFLDTLAVAQASAIQANLALRTGKAANVGAAGSHVGFGHECNALLAFLYNNDPNFVPLPSTFRAGTGYTYKSQTHDITIINQHWGDVHSIIPVEVKARARQRDRRRYKALIIPGKMRLTPPSNRRPYVTTEAFAACYEGTPTDEQSKLVERSATTVKDLLTLYRQGDCPEEFIDLHTPTTFHETTAVAEKYKELSWPV